MAPCLANDKTRSPNLPKSHDSARLELDFTSTMPRDQAQDAQDLYDDRSAKYDDSHHPRLAKHYVEMAKIQAGEHVLDLACGTGLVSYLASTAVGPTGSVVGIDISTGMLAQAEAKKANHKPANVSFYTHSITALDSLEAIKPGTFDVVACCSALVLLERPGEALKQWTTYLKPGGRLITDVTHIQNLLPGTIFEAVGRRIERPLPWYRLVFQKPDDLVSIMEAAGLSKIDVTLVAVDRTSENSDDLQEYIRPLSDPKILREYEVRDADRVFDEQIDKVHMKSLASPPEIRDRARALFKEEWANAANAEGKLQEVDGIWVSIGWKE